MAHIRLITLAFSSLLSLALALYFSSAVAQARQNKSKKQPAQAAPKNSAQTSEHGSEEPTESGDDDSIQVQVVAPKRKGNKQNVNEEDGFNSERSYRYGNEELEVDPD